MNKLTSLRKLIPLTLVLFLFSLPSFANDTNPESCIEISTPSQAEIDEIGYLSWPIWSGEAITYPEKTYTSTEYCFFIEGELKIVTPAGEAYHIKPGQLVVFKKGCTCTWHCSSPVKKHYSFE